MAIKNQMPCDCRWYCRNVCPACNQVLASTPTRLTARPANPIIEQNTMAPCTTPASTHQPWKPHHRTWALSRPATCHHLCAHAHAAVTSSTLQTTCKVTAGHGEVYCPSDASPRPSQHLDASTSRGQQAHFGPCRNVPRSAAPPPPACQRSSEPTPTQPQQQQARHPVPAPCTARQGSLRSAARCPMQIAPQTWSGSRPRRAASGSASGPRQRPAPPQR